MGLFRNKGEIVSKVSYEQIPDASAFNSSEILGFPIAEYVRELEGPFDPYAAYMLSVDDKYDEAELALRNIIDKADAANVWLAQMELGTLLIDFHDRIPEANYILVQCLGCPFLDVARNAAWNLAELLKHNGHEAKAEGYADLAISLHSSIAMVVVAERLAEEGLEKEVLAAFEFAAENTPRIDPYRPRIEIGLVKERTSGVQPHAAGYFERGLGRLTRENFSSSNVYVNSRELFNTEAGSAAIATKYFGECKDECYFEPVQIDCQTCGRNPKNYISVPSGDGDGVYPVFTFLSEDSGEVGSITIFRGLLDDLIDEDNNRSNATISSVVAGHSATWASILGSGAPVVLGEIAVDDNLIFSDGSKCSNDHDLAVVIETKPDKYAVICWLSAPDQGDDTIRPLALAAVRGALRHDLLEVIDSPSLDEVNTLRKELWGGDYTVHANVGDLRTRLAIRNFEMAADEDADRLSWLLQQAEFKDEGLYSLIQSQSLPSESQLRALLSRRGMFNPKLPWFDSDSQTVSSATAGLTKTGGGLTKTGGLSGGVGLSEGSTPLAQFCVSCGNRFDADEQKFCGHCGTAR